MSEVRALQIFRYYYLDCCGRNRAISLDCDVIMKELTYFVGLLGQSSNCGESHPALLDCNVIMEEITLFGWIVAEGINVSLDYGCHCETNHRISVDGNITFCRSLYSVLLNQCCVTVNWITVLLECQRNAEGITLFRWIIASL